MLCRPIFYIYFRNKKILETSPPFVRLNKFIVGVTNLFSRVEIFSIITLVIKIFALLNQCICLGAKCIILYFHWFDSLEDCYTIIYFLFLQVMMIFLILTRSKRVSLYIYSQILNGITI